MADYAVLVDGRKNYENSSFVSTTGIPEGVVSITYNDETDPVTLIASAKRGRQIVLQYLQTRGA